MMERLSVIPHGKKFSIGLDMWFLWFPWKFPSFSSWWGLTLEWLARSCHQFDVKEEAHLLSDWDKRGKLRIWVTVFGISSGISQRDNFDLLLKERHKHLCCDSGENKFLSWTNFATCPDASHSPGPASPAPRFLRLMRGRLSAKNLNLHELIQSLKLPHGDIALLFPFYWWRHRSTEMWRVFLKAPRREASRAYNPTHLSCSGGWALNHQNLLSNCPMSSQFQRSYKKSSFKMNIYFINRTTSPCFRSGINLKF